LAYWQMTLNQIKVDWARHGEGAIHEVALIDALLAILVDQAPSVPDDNIYTLLIRQVLTAIKIYQLQAQQPAKVSPLPQNTVQTLAQNTHAVKTKSPEKSAEWHQVLIQIKADWQQRGDAAAYDISFIDALLAIMSDQVPTMPGFKPYAEVIREIVDAIRSYHAPRDLT
jgi:hypothetical protein